MIPVPWVRIEFAMCRMLIVFRCLLLLVFSIKIWVKRKKNNIQEVLYVGILVQNIQNDKEIVTECLEMIAGTSQISLSDLLLR